MFKTKLVSVFLILFFSNNIVAQSAIDKKIKAQAEEMAQATVEGKYEVLVKYTHPNVIESSGGKKKLLDVLSSQMEKMASDGFLIESLEIGDPIDTQLYKGEYQTLVPKTTTMFANGQKIVSRDYLFGFSDKTGDNWTFTEAYKLKTERAKLIFPDFETNIEIPEKENPVIIDESGEVEVLEFDENEGTYANTDEMVDRAFGYIGLGIGILFLIVFACVAVFLIFYFRRKNKKEIKEDLAPQPIITKTDKKICKECDGENRADSKYCSLCGYTL